MGSGRVTLVALSSVTHSFNMGQRFNELQFERDADGQRLHVWAPAGGSDCPPGPYMLFILNDAGVPSVARIVRIG